MNRLVKVLVITVSSCLVLFLMLGSVLGRSTTPEDVYRHFAVYTEVLSRIKSEYVEEPNMKNVTLGALNGLLESIDPYASYLNEDQYRQYLNSRKHAQAGVGLILSRRVGYLTVVDAVPGSPAAMAGITSDDIVETIGGVATRDMPLCYAEMLFEGKTGTAVDFTVLRVRQGAEPQEFHLTREPLHYAPVRSQMLPSGIGYLKVQSLEKGKSAEVARRLKSLMSKRAKKVVLDLRRSAVGEPQEGLALADLFLDKGLMGYMEGQKVPRQDFNASETTTICRLPIVVIINRGTAAGAEIAAAALLGNQRCKTVGQRSYGDAALRRAIRLNDGGAVILSVAKYHSPDGKAIQDTGVTPSVPAVATEPAAGPGEEQKIEPRPEPSPDEDTVLQKAIEVLAKGSTELARDVSLEPDTDPGQMRPLTLPGRPR